MAVPAITVHASCAQCGKPFSYEKSGSGRPRLHCTDECRVQASNKRKEQARRDRGIAPRRWYKDLPPTKCSWCQCEFPTRTSKAGKFQQFCSRACQMAVRTKPEEHRRLVKLAGKERQRRRAGRRPMVEIMAEASLRREEEAQRIAQRTCPDCSAQLQADRTGYRGACIYCAPCAEKRARSLKRSNRVARKAAERTATVEWFDPVEVLERDGWRCHLCGIRTPKRLRGTHADNAPELDHIVPLAAGGEHSRINTACACRRCNRTKSDRPMGQMRLVA